MAVQIQGVEPGSPADVAGIRPGMQLCAINGHTVRDGLDYEFYAAAEALAVEVAAPEAEHKAKVETGTSAETGSAPRAGTRTFHIAKEQYQPLGLVFESFLMDGQHACKNGCVFCFVDQLPKGLRPSLYFKDDDERLSFLFGNYITLTNLSDEELERIIAMRIAPINISVHTANPALRVQMMKNRWAGEKLAYIPRLAEAGIPMNSQLVLCPGLNDGDELRRSIEWLASFAPAMQSIAAVPVGLSRHREGLFPLRAYTREEAAAQLDILLDYGDRFAKEGCRLVYPSDEWFLLAGRPLPEEDFYDGYPQLENGVGMWRLLHTEFMQALAATPCPAHPCAADMVVGKLAEPLFRELADALQKRCPEVKLHVHGVENRFFGPGVTVTGLLTGQDMAAALAGKLQSGTLLLPACTLRAEGDLLLDDTTPAALQEALGAQVQVVPNGGDALLEAIFAAGV